MAEANKKGKTVSTYYHICIPNANSSREIGAFKKRGMEGAAGQRTPGDVENCWRSLRLCSFCWHRQGSHLHGG